MCVCMHNIMCVCVCLCIYTHTHSHTHAQSHTASTLPAMATAAWLNPSFSLTCLASSSSSMSSDASPSTSIPCVLRARAVGLSLRAHRCSTWRFGTVSRAQGACADEDGDVTGREEWLGDRGGSRVRRSALKHVFLPVRWIPGISGLSMCPRLAVAMTEGSGVPTISGVNCALALESQDSGSEDSSASDIVCCEF